MAGAVWFVIYLVMIGLRERIALGGEHPSWIRALLFVAALVPIWIFWSLTPALLVRDGGRGWRYLAVAGLAGTAISGAIIPLAARIIFTARRLERAGPDRRRHGVDDVVRNRRRGWVVTACIGAVLWERTAPADTVIGSESAMSRIRESIAIAQRDRITAPGEAVDVFSDVPSEIQIRR